VNTVTAFAAVESKQRRKVRMQPHPDAPHHIPWFVPVPGETDVLMVVMAVVLVAAVLGIGVLFLTLHSLPERMAHKGKKLQFEVVGVLCLLALFTHVHLFWVAALLLAFIDLPDFGGSLNRMAGSLETMAGRAHASGGAVDSRADQAPSHPSEESPSIAEGDTAPDESRPPSTRRKELLRA
jgi:hypothetical protein